MRLTPISAKINAEIKKIENAQRTNSASKAKNLKTDKSDFSKNAQRLSDTQTNIETAKLKIEAEPEIREEKVSEVRKKIDSGYYNSPELIDKLADKIIKDFGLMS